MIPNSVLNAISLGQSNAEDTKGVSPQVEALRAEVERLKRSRSAVVREVFRLKRETLELRGDKADLLGILRDAVAADDAREALDATPIRRKAAQIAEALEAAHDVCPIFKIRAVTFQVFAETAAGPAMIPGQISKSDARILL